VARLAPLVHAFSHYRLHADLYAIDLARCRRDLAGAGRELWIDLADARGAALPAPVKRLLEGLHGVSPWHGARP